MKNLLFNSSHAAGPISRGIMYVIFGALFVFLTGNAAMAQTNSGKTIRGTVYSKENNEPLAGVNVYLKGFTEGVATDADGNFEFPRKLYNGDELVFSFVGLETIRYSISSQTQPNLDIRMEYNSLTMTGDGADASAYSEPQTRGAKLWNRIKGIF